MDKSELIAKAKEYVSLEKNPGFRHEVQELLEKNDLENLTDRFFTELTFGTGGLRGVIGGGLNRMNPFVVQRTTQGLANYIKKTLKDREGSVVIAHDSRNYSDLFALEAALVLCANGIKTALFPSLRPTPELSFAVRTLKATAGIVITASHNPAEYNGYKVYWSDGGQIVPPHDQGIIGEVLKVKSSIRSMEQDEALSKGLLSILDETLDKKYIEVIKNHSLRPDLVKERGKDLKVIYTPLHGSGTLLVEKTLKGMGIEVLTVPQQREPDGNFPTVKFPNPEEASALKLAIDLAKAEKADLVMATDPDSDRLGIAVPENGEYRLITGNQLGALLADYIFLSMAELSKLPKHPVLIKTIVTTELQTRIAENYGAKVYDVLTGFKYIAEGIRGLENSKEEYVFGGEESYGFLIGTEVRDKDAVGAAAMTAEMALYNISQGRTVLDYLNSLYQKYGYFEELLVSKYFKGQAGLAIMQKLMIGLRENPPLNFGGSAVKVTRDYLTSLAVNKTTGEKQAISLPASDVLQFVLADGTVVTVRPSGTEPKIKFYASCHSSLPVVSLEAAKTEVAGKLRAIHTDIEALITE